MIVTLGILFILATVIISLSIKNKIDLKTISILDLEFKEVIISSFGNDCFWELKKLIDKEKYNKFVGNIVNLDKCRKVIDSNVKSNELVKQIVFECVLSQINKPIIGEYSNQINILKERIESK